MAAAFVQHPAMIKALFGALPSAPDRQAARMAWVIEEISCLERAMLDAHKSDILTLLFHSDLQAVLRNLLKVLLLYSTDEAEATALFDRCIHLAANPVNDIAVRCNAFSLAHHIARQFPGLEQELFLLTDLLGRDVSVGLYSRTRKLLRK